MIEGLYDVIFRGQTVKSFELDDVKTNLVKLFKSTPEGVERLFSGNEVTIRKGLDYAAAMKYQSALRNAGALALIKEIENTESKLNDTQQQQSSQPELPTKQLGHAASQHSNNDTTVETESTSTDLDDGLTVADVGAQILPEKIYEQKEVDTSHFSLATVGERILPKKEPEKHKQPSIEHLSLTDN